MRRWEQEQRETEDFGTRAYVSTIPGQAVTITAALNEFNHSVQRFPSVAEYEAARANYCEDIIVREALVEDAITGNMLRIKDQTLHISTATEAQDNVRSIPAEWNVNDVRDLVGLLLVASPGRAMGLHPAQPVLVRGVLMACAVVYAVGQLVIFDPLQKRVGLGPLGVSPPGLDLLCSSPSLLSPLLSSPLLCSPLLSSLLLSSPYHRCTRRGVDRPSVPCSCAWAAFFGT